MYKGLYIIIEDRLVLDQRFRPLTDLIPVDVTIQSGAKALYYLYEDRYLPNAYAGIPYGEFEPGAYSSIAVNESGAILLAGDRNFKLISVGSETTGRAGESVRAVKARGEERSEEHTSELQSRGHLVCRLLLEKK